MLKKIPLIFVVLYACTAASQQLTFEKFYDYGYAESANSVQQTFDGGYILAGRQGITFGETDLMLIKTDSTGEVEWEYFYGTGININEAFDVIQIHDSGYVAVGRTTVLNIGATFILKVDVNGEYLWSKTYSTSESDRAESVEETNDGGLIIAGNRNGEFATLLRTDKNGDSLWLKKYLPNTGDNSIFFSVATVGDSGFVATGSIRLDGESSNVYVVRTDLNGDTMWTRSIGGTEFDNGRSIALTNDGGYIVTGYTWSFGAGRYDVYLIKLNQNGNVEWTKTFGDEYNDQGFKIQQTKDGGYVIMSYTSQMPPDINSASWIIKIDSGGEKEWESFYNVRGSTSIFQTSDNGFVFSGRSSGSAFLIKINEKVELINNIDQLNSPEQEVKVYPNPLVTQSIVEITAVTDFSNTTLHLYNTTGQEVLTKTVKSPQTTIYRNNLPAGIYILQVRQATKTVKTAKILIQ